MKKLRSICLRSVALALVAGCLGALPAARAQTPVADYQFQNTLDNSTGVLGSLTTVGDASQNTYTTATVFGASQQVYNVIPPGTSGGPVTTQDGVQTPANPFNNAGNYSILLTASFYVNTGSSFATKVFDFKNLTTDAGLYIAQATGQLQFIDGNGVVIPGATGLVPVTSGNYFQLSLTRDATTQLVSAYLDGVQQFQFTDTNNLATLNTVLSVFADDGQGLGNMNLSETTLGSAARLRLYNEVLTQAQVAALVPEPAAWVAVASGALAGLVLLRRRRTA